MKRSLCLTVPAVGLAVLVGLAAADPAADPLTITPEAGPWVICAASYMGEEAPCLARQLAEQLRTRHQLTAYVFDRGDEDKKRDWEEHKRKEAALGEGIHLPFKHPRYTQNCAVLIGGFPDMDSANAALARVKKLPMPDLKLSTGAPAVDTEIMIQPDEDKKAAQMYRVKVNPLARSFVTRNPTVPVRTEPVKVDPIWKELNAPESYSLLKNRKAWTLVVKDYKGTGVVQNRTEPTGFLEKLGQLGRKPVEGMTAVGMQAHALAELLRDKKAGGFDAYVLHTRTSSIVTVGGFDGPDDPELERTRRRLESLSFKSNVPGKVDPIGLFPHPVPMEVPHF